MRHAPMYYIVLCAHTENALPEPGPGLWLFDDHGETVYRHYQGEIKRNMAAGAIIADREQEIQALKRQLKAASGQTVSWLMRLLGRG